MCQSDKEKAGRAAHVLPAETSRMIVQLGQERLKALQTSGIALDARTTQVAAIQLAAAAFAGGMVDPSQGVAKALFAALGCLLFVIGSGIAFLGIYSCNQQAPGVEPSWWFDATRVDQFTDDDGRCWAAELTEEMIEFSRGVDEKRSVYLNRSLGHGLAGGVMVALAAFGRMWS